MMTIYIGIMMKMVLHPLYGSKIKEKVVMKMPTRYECPNGHGIFFSQGCCPDCGAMLDEVLLEASYPYETESVPYDEEKD